MSTVQQERCPFCREPLGRLAERCGLCRKSAEEMDAERARLETRRQAFEARHTVAESFYLQGPGPADDAIIEKYSSGDCWVLVARGRHDSIDERMTAELARLIWGKLTAAGWQRVKAPRRSRLALQRAIRD